MKRLALSLLTACAVVALLRAFALSVYTVGGGAMEPCFHKGDRVVVSRWAYGLRTGRAGGVFGYGRIMPQPVRTGDIVAIDSPDSLRPGIALVRCAALPGDTVRLPGGALVALPRRADCADDDCYWMTAVGPGRAPVGAVPSRRIIGKVVGTAYRWR